MMQGPFRESLLGQNKLNIYGLLINLDILRLISMYPLNRICFSQNYLENVQKKYF